MSQRGMDVKTDALGNLKDLKNLYRGIKIYESEHKRSSSFFSYRFIKKGGRNRQGESFRTTTLWMEVEGKRGKHFPISLLPEA